MSDRNVEQISRATHLWYTTDLTQEEIGRKIARETGGRDKPYDQSTVSTWINSDKAEVVDDVMEQRKREVLLTTLEELKQQLREAASSARTAETPVEVWTNEDGDLMVEDKTDESGQVVDRYPVPIDYELGPDEQTRFYRREEIRDILDQMVDLLNISPEEIRVEHSGAVSHEIGLDDDSREMVADLADDFKA